MPITNPVLWIFFGLVSITISSISMVISIPMGIITYFYQKNKISQKRAIWRAILMAFIIFLVLFVVGCLVSIFTFQGPLD